MEEVKHFFFQMFGVQRMFFQCLHASDKVELVHPRQGPILGILLHGCGSSQADIVREMKVSAATVAVSVARLEKLGLVTRERNLENQRANILHLTDKGREIAVQMQNTMAEIGQAALRGFSEEECSAMEGYWSRMMQNLQSQYHTKE